MPSRDSTGARRAPRRAFSIAILLLAGLYAALLFHSAANENETNDESAHIAAGYSYWLTGDFRLNPEHPPLSKLLCTAPLLVLHPHFPNDPVAWNNADEFRLGHELLYSSPNQVQQILLACRWVTIFFTASFAVCLAFWGRRHFSDTAALLIFLFFILDPNIAAHARYVTSDAFVSAFFFLACVLWYSWLRDGRKRDLWLTGISFALALGSKFNAVLLVPVLFLMWALQRWRGPRRNLGQLVVPLVILPACVLFALYAGDTRSVSNDPLIRSRLQAKSQHPATWERIPVPAYYWFRGIQLLSRHEDTGHLSYLLGKLSYSGFLSYFPVAVLVKTATGTLLLFAAAILLFFCNRKRAFPVRFTLPWALSIPPLLYFAVAMLSRVDIGIRHIILIYPFFYVLAGWAFDRYSNRKFVPASIAIALLLNLAEFIRIYPHPIAFFNALSGGPNAGPHYLLDSNIDWGQGLIDLHNHLASRPHSCVALSYFGRAETSYYVGGTQPVPGSLSEAKTQPCLIAVSVEHLYGDPEHRLSYLLAYRPIARPSYSIYVYDPARLSK